MIILAFMALAKGQVSQFTSSFDKYKVILCHWPRIPFIFDLFALPERRL